MQFGERCWLHLENEPLRRAEGIFALSLQQLIEAKAPTGI